MMQYDALIFRADCSGAGLRCEFKALGVAQLIEERKKNNNILAIRGYKNRVPSTKKKYDFYDTLIIRFDITLANCISTLLRIDTAAPP